jgi:hypothetical protein
VKFASIEFPKMFKLSNPVQSRTRLVPERYLPPVRLDSRENLVTRVGASPWLAAEHPKIDNSELDDLAEHLSSKEVSALHGPRVSIITNARPEFLYQV